MSKSFDRQAAGDPLTAGAKAAVRGRLLAARRALPAEVRAGAATRLREALVVVLTDAEPHTAAGYVPFGTEPGGADLPAVLARALPTGGRLLLPVLRDDLSLDWAVYQPPSPAALRFEPAPAPGETPRHPGEPVLDWRAPAGPRLGVASIGQADVVVAPALAVDRHGVRLGRGGGSYDRALALASPAALVVALLYDGELLGPGEDLPVEPHDRHVSAVITPSLGLVRLPAG